MSRHLRATVSYLGTRYVGWERQNNGLAIQEVLERALLRICREEVAVEGSGRTDAGVHAAGQVISFDLHNPMDLRKLRLGWNAVMPEDVSVLEIAEAPLAFHARKSATSKTYRYTIVNHPARFPLHHARSYHFPRPLDLGAVREGLRAIEGEHDFRAFAREAWRKKSCVRTIYSARLIEEAPLLHLELEGSGFLYNMIRILVGTLLEIGLGKRRSGEIETLLAEARPRKHAGYTVPARGLCLMEVRYEPRVGASGV